jgi:lysophospholipase L1-like esterase
MTFHPSRVFNILLIAAFILSGCNKSDTRVVSAIVPKKASTRPAGTIGYLALGDSYTIGEKVPEDDRWPMRLAELLRNEHLTVDPPDIVAVTGWTSGDLIRDLDLYPQDDQYDLVTLMIGVNNQYQHRSEDEFRSELNELLRRSISYARGDGRRVVVMSIPDWGQSPFGHRAAPRREKKEIGDPIDRLNAITKECCAAKGVTHIDVTTVTRTDSSDEKMFASDGLHYSRLMHEKWAELAFPAARTAITSGSPTTRPR